MSFLLAGSLALNVAMLAGAFSFVRSRGGWTYVKARMPGGSPPPPPNADLGPHWRHMMEIFAILDIERGDTVMLGDSLTEFGPWGELLGNPHVRNRGIAGDTIHGVDRRVGPVLAAVPGTIALLIGINDLLGGRRPEEVTAAHRALVRRIRAESPGTRLILQTLLPVNAQKVGIRHDANIRAVNAAMQETAKTAGAELLDLYPLFETPAGLSEAHSFDGLHLNGAGYRVWAEALKARLRS